MPHKKKASAASSAQESQASATVPTTTMRQVSKTLHDGHPLPQMFVFDLDYTLWPFWVDTHCSGGLKYVKTNCVSDRHGEHFSFYSEVPDLLQELRGKGIKIAAASRTQTPDLAKEMLKLLLLEIPTSISNSSSSSSSSSSTSTTVDTKPTTKKAIDFFDELQIFPANKVNHFNNLQQRTKIEYSEMIFFDDESRNRNVEKELGVVFVWVRDGVNGKAFDKGVEAWRKRWGKSHPLDGQQRRGGGGEDEL